LPSSRVGHQPEMERIVLTVRRSQIRMECEKRIHHSVYVICEIAI
jgi:hypothetical protein